MVVVDAESWGEYITLSKRTQTVTMGFLSHLLSLLIKCREDVITGKPEASKTFLIK